MTNSPPATLRVGDWSLNRLTGELARDGVSLRLEERALLLLTFMADHAGEVLSADDLLTHAWPGVVVSPDSLYQAITLLRRQLGDDARKPSYIATIPRRGYRLVAQVTQGAALAESAPGAPAQAFASGPAPANLAQQAGPPLRGRRIAIAGGIAALLVGGLATLPIARTGSTRSVAVLPFLDLTDDMNEEPFADGISEELIGKLSKQPGLAVAPPGASYYYKNKRDAAAEAARALKVAYVLDGSIRRSGGALRISARLTRAADGFVAWSDSYDRTPGDKLAIQEEIAGIVSRSAIAKIQ